MIENRIGSSERDEKSFEQYLFKYHKEKIELLDKLINILLKIFINIAEGSLKRSGAGIGARNKIAEYLISTNLLESDDSNLVCNAVSFELIYLAKRQLLAARKLILMGYLESMVAILRGSADSLYYSEICRQDFTQAKKWLRGEYLGGREEPKGLNLHKVVYKYRKSKEWRLWDKLSGMGVHPKLDCRVASLAGDFIGIFAEHDETDFIKENTQYIQLFMRQMDESLENKFLLIIGFSFDFNIYVRDIYKQTFYDTQGVNEEFNDTKRELLTLSQNIINKYRSKETHH